jgi:hypothetical protein
LKPNLDLKTERAYNKGVDVLFDQQSVPSTNYSLVKRLKIGQAKLKGYEVTTSYVMRDRDLFANDVKYVVQILIRAGTRKVYSYQLDI